MPFAKDSLSTNAMGGTELMKYTLSEMLEPTLLDKVQIFVSRVEEELDDTKYRILWLHDLPGDPSSDHLKNGGWQKFHKLVFVSNWQMQAYINYYGIPYSHCVVLLNAIKPFELKPKSHDKIKLAYWSTPHRGLEILVPVFEKLCEKHHNIELDVYSSFKLYGWDDRDKPYEGLFKRCQEHDKINYHGVLPNEELKIRLAETHILAYPSIWVETSCIVLMEAMYGKMQCVHPNLGALYETASNFTNMYQMHENKNEHARMFYSMLDFSIASYWTDSVQSRLDAQHVYANVFYTWNSRREQWNAFLDYVIQSSGSTKIEIPSPTISYRA